MNVFFILFIAAIGVSVACWLYLFVTAGSD